MTSRESITIRASASLKMILCLLSNPSSHVHVLVDLSAAAADKTDHCDLLFYHSLFNFFL